MMLQETKCIEGILKHIASQSLKANKKYAVDGKGASRGLDLIWNPQEIHLDNFNSSPNYLSSSFTIISYGINGFLTIEYELNIVSRKLNFLNQISSLGKI